MQQFLVICSDFPSFPHDSSGNPEVPDQSKHPCLLRN